MGLFDFLFKKKKKTSSLKSNVSDSEIVSEYINLTKETEKLKAENKEWEKEFNNTISLRQKAQQFEKDNKLNEAISVYLQAIELGEKSSKLNIYNYAHDIGRVIILYGKTKQKENLKRFLERNISKYPEFSDTKKWIVRLSKINNEVNTKSISLNASEVEIQKAGNPTLGKQINDFKRKMPEFNFYFDMPEGASTMGYQNNVPKGMLKKLGEYKEAFDVIKSRAKIAENEGDFKTAIEAYEKLVIEEYEDPQPFERLIIIYSKLKWKEKEINTLERAISFFTNLRNNQLDNVERLAKKYKMIDKAKEYINQNKKIYYYMGAFELYNPQVTRLEKWEKRLQKLNKN